MPTEQQTKPDSEGKGIHGKPKYMVANLVLLVRDDQVWLAIKKKKIAKDKWVSWGGGKEEGETVLESAVRELREESGGKNDPDDPTRGIRVRPEDLTKMSINTFITYDVDNTTVIFTCIMHTYVAYRWEGEPEETDEIGLPEWFPISKLPFHNMMVADREWMPYSLAGRRHGSVHHYSTDQTKLIAPSTFDFKEELE